MVNRALNRVVTRIKCSHPVFFVHRKKFKSEDITERPNKKSRFYLRFQVVVITYVWNTLRINSNIIIRYICLRNNRIIISELRF